MRQLPKQILAIILACATGQALSLPVSGASAAGGAAVGQSVTATITGKHGTVFKRSFRDWNREDWGEPEPAELSDCLREGMQLGTGNQSWAEVTWPNVKTRAWSNTVFAVAPNKRLVYLTGGEMLFRLDKNRKDKDDYYIWTKVLQARIRGTSVLVQAKGAVTRFSVLEGTVELTNRLDKSRIILKPGVVYEIKGYNISQRAPMPSIGKPARDDQSSSQATPLVPAKPFDGSIKDISYDEKSYIPLFQDKFATTNLYAANSESLLNHPLITAGEPIDSLPLIQAEQKDLPGYSKALPIKVADNARLNKVVFSRVEVLAVPSKADYFIGQSVGKNIKLPAAAYGDLQPKGMVLNPSNIAAEKTQVPTAAMAPRPVIPAMLPGLLIEAPGADGNDNAKVFDEQPQPLPQKPYGSPGLTGPGADKDEFLKQTQVPTVVPTTCLTPNNSGPKTPTAAFQPLPGTMPADVSSAIFQTIQSRRQASQNMPISAPEPASQQKNDSANDKPLDKE